MNKRRFRNVLKLLLIIACLYSIPASAEEPDLFLDGCVQTLFTSENGLLTTASTAITQTKEGFIWIGGYGGLVRYDGETFEPFETEISGISDLKGADDGSLWIGSSDKGLFQYKDHILYPILSEKESENYDVECIEIAEDGTVWFGTEYGIGKVSEEGTARMIGIPELEDDYIRSILSAEGNLYCITRGGELFCYNGKNCERIGLGSDSTNVRSIEYDETCHCFYIGTAGKLVLKYDRDFTNREIMSVRSLECINDVCCINDDTLLVCADNGIAVVQNGKSRVQKMKIANSVDNVLIDMEGNYWFISSRQGILEVSASRFRNLTQIAGLDPLVVNSVEKVGNRLYIGHDDGLLILDINTYKEIEDENFSRLTDVRVRAILHDSRDRLWFCTRNKGLFCLDENGEWKVFDRDKYPILQSDSFRCICECGDGAVLVGTDEGAYRVRRDTVEGITGDPEIVSRRILGVLCAGDTNYLGTDGYGLYVVRNHQVVQHLTTEDGLLSNAVMKIKESAATDGYWLINRTGVNFLDADGNIRSVNGFPSINCMDIVITENRETWIFTGGGIYQTTEEEMLSEEEMQAVHYRRSDGIPFEATANANQCLDGSILYICGSGGVMSMNLDKSFGKDEDCQLVLDYIEEDGEKTYFDPEYPVRIADGTRRVVFGAHVVTYRTQNPYVFYYLEGFDDEPIFRRKDSIGEISYTNLNGGDYIFHLGLVDHESGDVIREITSLVQKSYRWYEHNAVKGAGILLGAVLIGIGFWFVIRRQVRHARQRLLYQYEIKEKQQLQEIAYKDYLTGLYNRNYLSIWNEKVLPSAASPISFIFLDVNNLKVINDNIGHKHGDSLLVEMAHLLTKHFCAEGDSVIRMGGDEYLVMTCGTDNDTAKEKIEQVSREAREILIGGIPMSFGYGICTRSQEGFDFEEALRESDLALLKAKDIYHGRV